MKIWIQGTEQGLLELSDLILEAVEHHTAERADPWMPIYIRCEPTIKGGPVAIWFELDGAPGEWKGDPSETTDWRWTKKE
jgi:hypothetical protein